MSTLPLRKATLSVAVIVPLIAANTAALAIESESSTLQEIVVTSQHLNDERSKIEVQTGASTYTIDEAAIQAIPGGDNVELNQIMLQLPNAAQDSFGQLHIRGDHNGLQFRLNGVILPDGISVFGQTLTPRFLSSLKLVTGSLPAEFGLRSAGIIDLTTKSGELEPGGSVTLYGGSHSTIEPSFNYGGSSGENTYFVSGDFNRNDLGIESPDGRSTPLHDRSKQYHGSGYFEHIIDDSNRVALIVGSSNDRFQIPNQAGLQPGLGLTVNGQTMFPSEALDENQVEVTHFVDLSLQHSQGDFSILTAIGGRYSSLSFTPDPKLGDIFYNGLSERAYKRDVAYTLQSDAAYHLNDSHTIRAGLYSQRDRLTSNATSQVLPTDDAGAQTSDVPVSVIDNSQSTQWIESLYLQDEWSLFPVLTVNYGVRFDRYSAFSSGHQLSPRINFVWQAASDTIVHAGYSRFFSPPPFELVGSTSIGKFLNTTGAPGITVDDPVKPERSNYYDVGVQQKIGKDLTLGVDSYYKQATDLIDEGQFGAPIILTPFNYRYGQVYGVEFTGQYTHGAFQAYGNFAIQRDLGKDLESSQFNFSADDLAYVSSHYIHLDHEQQYTGSAGASYLFGDTRISSDILLGSGLRASLDLPNGTSIPNGAHLPYYRQVNFGINHDFSAQGASGLSARIDVVNVFDQKYQIRNGTGVGVGAPQYGPRRGFFLGITQSFGHRTSITR